MLLRKILPCVILVFLAITDISDSEPGQVNNISDREREQLTGPVSSAKIVTRCISPYNETLWENLDFYDRDGHITHSLTLVNDELSSTDNAYQNGRLKESMAISNNFF